MHGYADIEQASVFIRSFQIFLHSCDNFDFLEPGGVLQAKALETLDGRVMDDFINS